MLRNFELFEIVCFEKRRESSRQLVRTNEIMNSSALSPNTLGSSSGQRTPEPEDSELNSTNSQSNKILNHVNSELQVQKHQKRASRELHIKRVQSLRKELDYLKATEWKYQPIDR